MAAAAAAVPTMRNFSSGRRKRRRVWHSRQISRIEEPRTAVMPGEGKEVEQVLQVGVKGEGRRSVIVQFVRSR